MHLLSPRKQIKDPVDIKELTPLSAAKLVVSSNL